MRYPARGEEWLDATRTWRSLHGAVMRRVRRCTFRAAVDTTLDLTMRSVALLAAFCSLVVGVCAFAAFAMVIAPTDVVLALGLAPFLVGATAAICRRKWGARAVWIGFLLVLLPPVAVMFVLPNAGGAKLAAVLVGVLAVPFFGAVFLVMINERCSRQ